MLHERGTEGGALEFTGNERERERANEGRGELMDVVVKEEIEYWDQPLANP